MQENWVFYFCQKLTFSVQISMISGRFRVKIWHFHSKNFHFKFYFWQKSVKLLRWPKNEHSYISMLSTLSERNFISMDKIIIHKFYLISFTWFISIFLYLIIFYWIVPLFNYYPTKSIHILIFYLSWNKHLIILYINI